MSHVSKRPNSGTQSQFFMKKVPGYLFFCACGTFFCWLFLCICAGIMCITDLSGSWHTIFTVFSSMAAIFLAAILYAGRLENGALGGVSLAIGGWVILSIIGTVQQNSFTRFSLIRIFSFLCVGALGGLLGMIHKQKKSHKKMPKRSRPA